MTFSDFKQNFIYIFNDIKPYLTLFNIIKTLIFVIITGIILAYCILINIFLFGYVHQIIKFASTGDLNVFNSHVTHENYMHNFFVLGIVVYCYFIVNNFIKISTYFAARIF